jgi:hypothetical protein
MRRLLVLALLLLASVLSCGKAGPRETTYRSHVEAQRTGAFSAGFVPEFLPRSATSIRETHEPGSGATLVRFQFGASDLSALRSACSAVPPDSQSPAQPAFSASVAWWPASLASGSLERFRCGSAPDSFLLLDLTSSTAYYWRQGT